MSSSSPLKPWTELPEGLKDLPRKGFVRRPPATHEEHEAAVQEGVFFDVENLSDVLRLANRRPSKSSKTGVAE